MMDVDHEVSGIISLHYYAIETLQILVLTNSLSEAPVLTRGMSTWSFFSTCLCGRLSLNMLCLSTAQCPSMDPALRLIRGPLPCFGRVVCITTKFVTEAFCMLRQESGRLHSKLFVQLQRKTLHSLACTQDYTLIIGLNCTRLCWW